MRIEMNGRMIDAEGGWSAASSFGHFTAMQVRNGSTRGLHLHLRRLEQANHELFDAALDGDRIRALIRHGLAETTDASVRVYQLESGSGLEPDTVVTVRKPDRIASPQGLRSVGYQRPDAHLKHLATEQRFHTRRARAEGYDDALLTTGRDLVSESATANIGFFDGDDVVWPDAPMLRGITMQLLETALADRGVPTRRAPIRLRDLPRLDGAFLSNARGIAAVDRIDELVLPRTEERIQALIDAYAAVPWDAI